MKTREEVLKFGMSFKNVYEEKPFHDPNWQLIRVKGSKKAFLWIYERNGYINLNVKADPEWRDFWRSAYESVTAGYHQNKEHWNTIILDGSIPDKDIRRMIAESYDLITDSPTKRIYEAVKRIPKGHVATYGKVAEMAGNPKMSRAVGNALHKNPDPEHIPCFRVVELKGRTCRSFCIRRRRRTGKTSGSRRRRSGQWQSRSQKIWNLKKRREHITFLWQDHPDQHGSHRSDM